MRIIQPTTSHQSRLYRSVKGSCYHPTVGTWDYIALSRGVATTLPWGHGTISLCNEGLLRPYRRDMRNRYASRRGRRDGQWRLNLFSARKINFLERLDIAHISQLVEWLQRLPRQVCPQIFLKDVGFMVEGLLESRKLLPEK